MNNEIALQPTGSVPVTWRKRVSDSWAKQLPIEKSSIALAALLLAVILAIAGSMLFQPSKGVDVVNGVPAVSNQFAADAHSALDELRAMKPADRAGYINRRYPDIGRNIVMAMRDSGKLAPGQSISRIDYLYGSMNGVVAETANGGTATGHFKEQLLAVVYPSGAAKPVVMLVFCSNGLVEFPAGALQNLQTVGQQTAPQMAFTIGRGKGLASYVDYRTAIRIAQHFNLPIQKKVMGGRYSTITAAEAYRLEPDTARVLVMTRVYTGDRFDLSTMTYTPARAH